MKLRSLLLALTLGIILYLTPLLHEYLPYIPLWNSLSRLSEEQATETLQNPNRPEQLAVQPTATGSGRQHETAMLFITKGSSPTIVTAGEPLTYTIVVTNAGPAIAQNITIYDELPVGVHFQGESNLTVIKGENPQLQVTDRQVTGTVSTLQPTGRIVFIGRTLVDPTASGALLYNTAEVTATNNSNNNNRAMVETALLAATATPTPTATTALVQTPTPVQTATPLPTATVSATVATPTATAVPNLADLQISKTAAPEFVSAGTVFTYTIVVRNLGPGRAQNLVIRDLLPQDLFFAGQSTLAVLRGEQPQLILSRSQLTGTLTMLHSGGLVTITAPVRAPFVIVNPTLLNQASLTTTTPDPQLVNNSAGAQVTLLPAPPLDYKTFLPAIAH